MTLTLKKLGAALITVGLMSTAQATLATINFDELRPSLSNAAGGIDDGDTVTSQYIAFGLQFAGLNRVHCSQFFDRRCVPPLLRVTQPPTTPNFLSNTQGTSFSINVLNGFSLNSISLSYAANANQHDVRLFGFDTGSQAEYLISIVPGSSSSTNSLWLPVSFGGVSAAVRRIEFHAGDAGASFSIDNLGFDFVRNSSNVPEPAALGLVALALAGVQLTRRRAV